MTNLFTYGSLMCSDIMLHASGQESVHKKAILEGYFRSHIKEETYPAIVPQSGQEVEGVVYFDLKPSSISRLDAFEGEYYMREEVVVFCKGLGNINAMAYIIKPKYYSLLTGKYWRFEDFLNKGKKEFLDQYFGFTKI